jgi:hypothetical protein
MRLKGLFQSFLKRSDSKREQLLGHGKTPVENDSADPSAAATKNHEPPTPSLQSAISRLETLIAQSLTGKEQRSDDERAYKKAQITLAKRQVRAATCPGLAGYSLRRGKSMSELRCRATSK